MDRIVGQFILNNVKFVVGKSLLEVTRVTPSSPPDTAGLYNARVKELDSITRWNSTWADFVNSAQHRTRVSIDQNIIRDPCRSSFTLLFVTVAYCFYFLIILHVHPCMQPMLRLWE